MTLASFAYLSFLLVSIAGMVVCDYCFRLAFFLAPRRALTLSALLLVLFLCWDALGIATGTFFRGGSAYMTGITLAPEMPVEEPIFLFFLSYLTINLTTATRRQVSRRVPVKPSRL